MHLQCFMYGPQRLIMPVLTALQNPALMATKSSIIVLYLRLSHNAHKLFRVASWITFAVVNIAGLVLTFFNVFQCIPVSQVFAPAGKCIPLITLYLASVPVNVITDLAVLVLPIPVLTAMRLPRKQKMILIATFGLGVYVIATDVIRVYYLQQSSGVSNNATLPLLGDEVDFAWHASVSFMWSAVEANVGIVCACIPTLKPLISRILPALIDNSRGSSCFGSWNKSSNPATTVLSSLTPADATGQLPSPISPLQPALTTNTDSLFVSRGRFSSHAIDWTYPTPSTTGDGTPDTERGVPLTGEGIQNIGLGLQNSLASPAAESEGTNRASIVLRRNEVEVFFGFIHLRAPRSMLRASMKDSIRYCTMVSVLFFLCGFSHGLWNNLNNQISKITSNSVSHTIGLYTAYFGAYAFGPATVGQYVLRRATFKATFITGLCIYGTGTFIYWPSEVLLSYPGFLIGNFFVGFGLSVIEMAANPFLFLCGPAYYGEVRLLLGQGVQGVGKLVGMIIAEKDLWHDIHDGPSLLLQWLYLAVALLDVALALTMYYLPLPEATDDDLQLQAQPGLPQLNRAIIAITQPEQRFRKINCRVIFVTLTLGFAAQFLCSGVQESNGLWMNDVLSAPKLSLTALNYGIIANASTASSPFVFAATCIFLPPRLVLLISFLGALLFSILVFSITGIDPDKVGALMITLYFFEGPIWPLIFATSLRRMGRRTKMAAAVLTSAASGAGFLPWLLFVIIKKDGRTAQYAYCLLIAFLGLGTLYPIYLSVFPAARQQVDRGEKPCPRRGSNGSPRNTGSSGSPRHQVTPPNIVVINGIPQMVARPRRMSRRLSSLSTLVKNMRTRRTASVADHRIELDDTEGAMERRSIGNGNRTTNISRP